MRHLSFKTQSANEKIVKRDWYLVDATNQTMGRMASRVASILRGKNKPYYTPHFDCGDYVIITNSAKIQMTGTKMITKEYQTFSGYPGGQKIETAKSLLVRRPNVAVERAVKGMLPKNRLGRAMYKKLFVYEGAEHPHTAQQPKELKFDNK
ncbi:MAG TPA: 50S ribosomal protein L13 [Flavipsychrobacter sp.]